MLSEEETRHVIADLSRMDTEYKVLLCSPEVVIAPEIQVLIKDLVLKNVLNFLLLMRHIVLIHGERTCVQSTKNWVCSNAMVYQWVALTATATKVTIDEITTTLQMKDPCIANIPCFRNSLRFEIIDKKNSFKESLNHVSEVIKTRFFGQWDCVLQLQGGHI